MTCIVRIDKKAAHSKDEVASVLAFPTTVYRGAGWTWATLSTYDEATRLGYENLPRVHPFLSYHETEAFTARLFDDYMGFKTLLEDVQALERNTQNRHCSAPGKSSARKVRQTQNEKTPREPMYKRRNKSFVAHGSSKNVTEIPRGVMCRTRQVYRREMAKIFEALILISQDPQALRESKSNQQDRAKNTNITTEAVVTGIWSNTMAVNGSTDVKAVDSSRSKINRERLAYNFSSSRSRTISRRLTHIKDFDSGLAARFRSFHPPASNVDPLSEHILTELRAILDRRDAKTQLNADNLDELADEVWEQMMRVVGLADLADSFEEALNLGDEGEMP